MEQRSLVGLITRCRKARRVQLPPRYSLSVLAGAAGLVARPARFDSAGELRSKTCSRVAERSRRPPVKRDEAGSIPAPGALRPCRAGSAPGLLIRDLRVRILPGAQTPSPSGPGAALRRQRVRVRLPPVALVCPCTHLVRRLDCRSSEASSILVAGASCGSSWSSSGSYKPALPADRREDWVRSPAAASTPDKRVRISRRASATYPNLR